MIQANELRIGNWVKYHDDTNIRVTLEIMIAQNHANKTSGHGSWIYPIPLTPKILEKCGIKRFGELAKQTQRKFYKIGKLVLELIANNRVAVYIDSETELILIGFQDYLHQLQNLYFALTGEELNIQL